MSFEWSDRMEESNIFLVGGIALFKEKEWNSVSEDEKNACKEWACKPDFVSDILKRRSGPIINLG